MMREGGDAISAMGYDDDPLPTTNGGGSAVPPVPRHHQPSPAARSADSSSSSTHLDEGKSPRQPSTMQRLLRCFAELDASLVLSVPRADLIRAIVAQYGLSESQARTVLLEKENELKEKIGSDGFNTRVFKRYDQVFDGSQFNANLWRLRNGTVVYTSERRDSNDALSPDGRSSMRQSSPPSSPAGFSWSPRSSSPPDSSESSFSTVQHPRANNTGSTFKSLSIKKHDLMRELKSSSSSLNQSMEDILIDPISMELMKKPVMLPCGHSFSRRTITKWLEQQNKCPSCNTPSTVDDLQPNYALRTVVRHYKKMAKQERLKHKNSSLISSSSTSESESRKKKKTSGKAKKDTKRKKKKESALPEGMEENMSPFAFFNAWVNGKDKKAKEERQARQRGEEDDDENNDEDIIATPAEGPQLKPDFALTDGSAGGTASPLPGFQVPLEQPGVSWFGSFSDQTVTTDGDGYQSTFSAESGSFNFSTSTTTAPTSFPSPQPISLMGDNFMVGYGMGNDEESMGRVGFSSSLFTFDESPKGTRRDRAPQVDEDDSTQDDEEEEEEGEQEEEESSSDDDEDDDAIRAHAGSWSSKSETIVIAGKDEDTEPVPTRKESDRSTTSTKPQGLIARFKALTSSSERSDESGEQHRKIRSKDSLDRREPEEQEEPDSGIEGEPRRYNSTDNISKKGPKKAVDDPEAEEEVDVRDKRSRSKSGKSGTLERDTESEQKLRLGLDVEYKRLRYDMQHKGTLVVASVRAPPAPSTLRNVVTSGSASRDKIISSQPSPSEPLSAPLKKRTPPKAALDSVGLSDAISSTGSSERAQVAVIAAIDRSSSMKGQKMTLVKESLQFLISQLSPGDCMGLVSYDEDVCTEIPLTFLDDSGKDSVLKAVSNIRTGLWTNLSGGLFSALQLLSQLPSSHSNMVCSILLFTDGGANRGITQTDKIVKALDSELRQLRGKSLAPTVFTFGFGTAPDANMLTKIAEMGNGLYYAIEVAEAIPAAFADCLGGLLSVCAENIRIKIEAMDGTTISKIFGNHTIEEHIPLKSYSILLGDIYYEEARDILLGLALPALDEPASSMPILSATLTYSSLPGGRHTTISCECSVTRPTASGMTADSVQPSYEVDKQRNRVSTAEAIKRAVAEQEGRRFDSAVAILTDAINQIQNSASASDPFCQSLVENLNECIIRTKRAKDSGGGPKTSYQSSLALAHSRQRSTHVSSTLTYSTTAKASTTLKFKTVSKSVANPAPSSSVQKAPRSHGDIKFLLANTKQLFERIRLIYALVEDHCNDKTCPKMTAGPKFEYLWKDDRYKQATALPAPQYISLLFQATEQTFVHGPNLHSIKDALRRLFRVYAHIYHHHVTFFAEIAETKLLEASFAAFVRFVREHGLVDERELLPMHRHPEVK